MYCWYHKAYINNTVWVLICVVQYIGSCVSTKETQNKTDPFLCDKFRHTLYHFERQVLAETYSNIKCSPPPLHADKSSPGRCVRSRNENEHSRCYCSIWRETGAEGVMWLQVQNRWSREANAQWNILVLMDGLTMREGNFSNYVHALSGSDMYLCCAVAMNRPAACNGEL